MRTLGLRDSMCFQLSTDVVPPCWLPVRALAALPADLGGGIAGIGMQEALCILFLSASFPSICRSPNPSFLPDGGSSVSVPLAAVLASVLCAHPRLIKALGRTQWSQEPAGLITGPALMFPKFRTDPGPRASVARLFIFVPV